MRGRVSRRQTPATCIHRGIDIPSTEPAAGFWKLDIDSIGSDLAHGPSENAPTNCDSSESEKSNDSPRMRGVWKSGSNCAGKIQELVSQRLDGTKHNKAAQAGSIRAVVECHTDEGSNSNRMNQDEGQHHACGPKERRRQNRNRNRNRRLTKTP